MERRNIITNVIIIAFFLCGHLVNAQVPALKFTPEMPKPGETVTIKYSPAGSKLERAKRIFATIHVYGKLVDEAYGKLVGKTAFHHSYEIELKKTGKIWAGKFTPADTSAGVAIHFSDGLNEDNNDLKIYTIRLHGNDGKFVQYASAGLVRVYQSFSSHEPEMEKVQDPNIFMALLNDEFSNYPQSKNLFIVDYYLACKKIDKDKAIAFLEKETERYKETATQSYYDQRMVFDFYNILQQIEKAEKQMSLIAEKYPKSDIAEYLRYKEIASTQDNDQKTELTNKFKNDFPNSAFLGRLFPDPNSPQALTTAGKYKEAYEAIKKKPHPSSGDYNNLAWDMFEKDIDLPLAKEIVLQGMKLMEVEKKAELKKAPRTYFSKRENIENVQASYGNEIIDTYGAILLKLGENEEALKVLTKAYKRSKGTSDDINERYKQALLANHK